MKKFVLFFACGGLVVVVDRWLKILARSGTFHDFGVGQFMLFKNNALVFSWPAPNWLAITLMLVAIAAVGWLAWKMIQKKNFLALFGCLLILFGAFSNLYDRFAFGYVIDWAYLGRWWPVFNLADVMIGVGVVLLLWRSKVFTKIK